MTPKQRIKHISKWIRDYARKAGVDTLVVGISGGIDSSVVSALCAETGLKTIVVQMPIRQNTQTGQSKFSTGWLVAGTIPQQCHTHEHGLDHSVLCV
jgi:NH3-dependent NAD+ synthetase